MYTGHLTTKICGQFAWDHFWGKQVHLGTCGSENGLRFETSNLICPRIQMHIISESNFHGLRGPSGLQMTSEATSEVRFELSGLNYLSSHNCLASNCHHSQMFRAPHLLLLLRLCPCHLLISGHSAKRCPLIKICQLVMKCCIHRCKRWPRHLNNLLHGQC